MATQFHIEIREPHESEVGKHVSMPPTGWVEIGAICADGEMITEGNANRTAIAAGMAAAMIVAGERKAIILSKPHHAKLWRRFGEVLVENAGLVAVDVDKDAFYETIARLWKQEEPE